MPSCFFVSDLHGNIKKYRSLFRLITKEIPDGLFIGGDILPSGTCMLPSKDFASGIFIDDFLATEFTHLRERLAEKYPEVFIILGNDDGRFTETRMLQWDSNGIWHYIHGSRTGFSRFQVYGYSFVPPTPFQLKDWERYDVSRYIDPGCVSPEKGRYSIEISDDEKRFSTIAADLEDMVMDHDLNHAIFLFHSPPYQTNLDRAALDGKNVEHVPLDVNVGSIAVRRFIEARQPIVTLHGHVHESARLTGSWKDKIGQTYCFSAAHDGPELALIRFDPEHPEKAERELVKI